MTRKRFWERLRVCFYLQMEVYIPKHICPRAQFLHRLPLFRIHPNIGQYNRRKALLYYPDTIEKSSFIYYIKEYWSSILLFQLAKIKEYLCYTERLENQWKQKNCLMSGGVLLTHRETSRREELKFRYFYDLLI